MTTSYKLLAISYPRGGDEQRLMSAYFVVEIDGEHWLTDNWVDIRKIAIERNDSRYVWLTEPRSIAKDQRVFQAGVTLTEVSKTLAPFMAKELPFSTWNDLSHDYSWKVAHEGFADELRNEFGSALEESYMNFLKGVDDTLLKEAYFTYRELNSPAREDSNESLHYYLMLSLYYVRKDQGITGRSSYGTRAVHYNCVGSLREFNSELEQYALHFLKLDQI